MLDIWISCEEFISKIHLRFISGVFMWGVYKLGRSGRHRISGYLDGELYGDYMWVMNVGIPFEECIWILDLGLIFGYSIDMSYRGIHVGMT